MARSRSRGWARGTYVASGLAFAGTLAALGSQMRSGADPALGAVPPAPPRPHLIVTKKIIRTTVATTRIVRPAPAPAPTPAATPAAAPVAAAPVAVQQAAPTYQAPPVQPQRAAKVVAAPVVRSAPAAPSTRAS